MSTENPHINLLIPLYNEEIVFDSLVERLDSLMKRSPIAISAILVDDGSSDHTSKKMKELAEKDARFTSVILSRNFGHQYALSAGMSYVDATEAVLILDGDLQDPPELLDDMYKLFKEGYDVVYAVRQKRKEGLLKKMAYKYFYRLLDKMSYIKIPLDSGDFSLVSRRVIDQLNLMREESRFLRGMRSWVGFNQIGINYERNEREQGDSKYTWGKLLKLALNGIFNFSELPIRFITGLGLLTISVSMIYFFSTLIRRFVFNVVPEGFTALLFVFILFGGVQLVSIGIIGEYIIRIFFQVKKRPLFIVKSVIKSKSELSLLE